MDFTSETPSSSSSTDPIEKEHMFDKVVTPSDVGKLNRLVIPKQHAEKYFPLDTSANEKGLLLNFEDRMGKPWRFRYSYWNSSQSYVMTKGWSRFVKEKKLDAGDMVSFGRGVNEKDRFFIDWKHRPEMILHSPPRFPRVPLPLLPPPPGSSYPPIVSFARSVGGAPWAGRLLVPTGQNSYLYNVSGGGSGSGGGGSHGSGHYLVYRSSVAPSQVTVGVPMVLDSVPVIQSQQAAAKRVRLFGVNLDSPDSDGDVGRSRASSSSSPSPLPSPKGKEKQKEEPSLDLEM